MLERRDRQIQDSLVSRDQALLIRLHTYNESMSLTTLKQINMRVTLELIGKRKVKLTKVYAKILN